MNKGMEMCIKNYNNNYQYEIDLSTGTYSWEADAYLTLYGPYDNIILKTFPFTGKKRFSLSTPIDKGDSWYYRYSLPSDTWTTDSSVSGWSLKNTNFDFATQGHTRMYFKRTFIAPSVVAYEASLRYPRGIVVYINGKEVFRDNIPSGDITSSTTFTGSYVDTTSNYHSIIRPANEIKSSPNIISVILFLGTSDNSIRFDAWLAAYERSYNSNVNCYKIPMQNRNSATDWEYSTIQTLSSTSAAMELVPSADMAVVHGFNIDMNGTPTAESGILEWEERYDGFYRRSSYHSFLSGSMYSTSYHDREAMRARFSINGAGSVKIREMSLLVCSYNGLNPQIEYSVDTYECTVNHQCTITPINQLSTGSDYSCSYSPPLSGMTISNAAVLSGIPTVSTNGEAEYKISCSVSNMLHTFIIKLNVQSPLPAPSNFHYSPSSVSAFITQSVVMNPSGSCPSCSYSVHSGSFPSGITINSSSGVISGSTTTSGTQSVVIKAQNAGGSSTTTVTLTIKPKPSGFSYPQSYYSIPKGRPFSVTPSFSGESISFSIQSGTLPNGLSLNSNTGIISGTPSTIQSQVTIVVRAANPGGYVTTTIRLTVTISPPISFIYNNFDIVATVGEAISPITPSVDCESCTFSVHSGTLPSGLTLNTNTGVITGTPTAICDYQQIYIKAENSAGSLTDYINIAVVASVSGLSYPGSPFLIGKGQAFSVSPSISSGSLTFSLLSGSLPTGLTLNTNTGVISGTPSVTVTSVTAMIKATNGAGSSVTTTVVFTVLTLPSGFSYSGSPFIIAKGETFSKTPTITGDSLTFSIQSGSLPTGLSLNSNTGVISGTPSQYVSSQSIVIKAENSLDSITTTVVFTIPSLPSGFSYSGSPFIIAKGETFSKTPTITGDSLTFSIQSGSLPTGLSLNSNTGVISGSPTVSVSAITIVIKASNIAGEVTTSITMTVITALSDFSYSGTSYVIAKNNQFMALASILGDSPTYSIQSGTLPPGLTLNPNTGAITGLPNQVVSIAQTITIKAENVVSSITATISIQVLTTPDLMYSQTQFVITTGVNFVTTPTTEGEQLTFSIQSGTLPSGLTLNPSTGSITGIPSQSTPLASLVIRAQNAVGSDIFTISFRVVTPPSALSYPQSSYTIPTGSYFAVSPAYDGDTCVFSIHSGTLPTGITLDTNTGSIQGTPTESTIVTLNIMAQNEGGSISTTLSVTVMVPPSSLNYPQTSYIISMDSVFSIIPEYIGESVTFAVLSGVLPDGLSLNANTGTILGTPSKSMTSLVQIQASNSVGTVTFDISIRVMIPPSSIHYPQDLCTLVKGEAFVMTPTYTGEDLVFSVDSGTLPVGLMLNEENGVISGSALSTVSASVVTIKATNQVGSKTATLTFTVKAMSDTMMFIIIGAITVIVVIVVIVLLCMCLKRKKSKSPELPIVKREDMKV